MKSDIYGIMINNVDNLSKNLVMH